MTLPLSLSLPFRRALLFPSLRPCSASFAHFKIGKGKEKGFLVQVLASSFVFVFQVFSFI